MWESKPQNSSITIPIIEPKPILKLIHDINRPRVSSPEIHKLPDHIEDDLTAISGGQLPAVEGKLGGASFVPVPHPICPAQPRHMGTFCPLSWDLAPHTGVWPRGGDRKPEKFDGKPTPI